MYIEAKARAGSSARHKAWRQAVCMLACGGLLVTLAPSAPGHSDARMFDRPGAAVATAATGASEVRLPAAVTGQEHSLFVLAESQAGPQASTLKTYGFVVPNAQAMLDVNLIVSGQVKDVYVRVGDSVRKGQPIISIFNPEFITTQRGHLEFLKNEEKLQALREEGRLPNYLKDAKENLRWWGMSDRQIGDLIEHGKVVDHITLDAPADGFVTDIFVQPGSVVNAGDRTMKQFVVVGKAVARLVTTQATPWVEGYVYPDQRALLRPGLPVRVGLPDGRQLDRHVTQVLPVMDPNTQRARFLIDLGRAPAGLTMGQAVDVSVRLHTRTGVWVPRQAVLGQAVRPIVYVKSAPGRYRRVPVAVLDESAALLRVDGLEAGAKVVVAGKMMLEGFHRISAGPGGAADSHHHDH